MGAAAKLTLEPHVSPAPLLDSESSGPPASSDLSAAGARPLPPFARESGLLGDALIQLRLAKRMALVDVAGAAGLHWRVVSRFEQGKRPTFEQLKALGRVFEVDPDALADLRAGRSLARTRPLERVELRVVVAPGAPGSSTWDELPWASDPYAQAAVVHGEEMSTEDIAARTGWSLRTVQRALEGALAKLATDSA